MLKQLYTPTELARVINKEDVWKYNLWSSKNDKDIKLKLFSERINAPDFEISDLKTDNINGKTVYMFSDVVDWLAIKRVDNYLKRIYKVKQANRNLIIKQLKMLLSEGGKYTLLCRDIKSFYESISLERCISEIKEKMILDYKGVSLLESLSQATQKRGIIGLPRGIGISTTLSELFARPIDKKVSKMGGVFYYVRYVDDLILVLDSNFSKSVESALDDLFQSPEFSLCINPKKSHSGEFGVNKNPRPSSYLGYLFSAKKHQNNPKQNIVQMRSEEIKELWFCIAESFKQYNRDNSQSALLNKLKEISKKDNHRESNSNEVIIDIDPEKIKKIKRRVAKSFLEYKKDNDFTTLLNRLRYISNAILLNRNINGPLFAGIAYNYREITRLDSLYELDNYLYSIIHGKCRIGKAVQRNLTPQHKIKLKFISFVASFRNNHKSFFTNKKAVRLRKIFIYG